MNWIALNNMAQLEQIKKDSAQKPAVIFKDSTTCGISAHAKHRLTTAWDFTGEEFDFYYLDLLTYRPISNQIAKEFGVVHQSPQLIVVKDGKAIFDTSHHAISTGAIKESLELA